MNIFQLNRNFWDFAFENPEKIKPNHCAVYFFSIEHCNRLGWKKNFGFPTSMVLEATGIKSYSVYKKIFDELVEFGFFKVIQYSKNQYSSNIIALKENYKAHDKALDKALIKHTSKHCESTHQSIDSIDIQDTNKQIKQINQYTNETEIIKFSFDDFWSIYPNKTGKAKAKESFNKVLEKDLEKLEIHLTWFVNNPPFEKYIFPHATTYLNEKRYLDDINTNNNLKFNNHEQQRDFINQIKRNDPTL